MLTATTSFAAALAVLSSLPAQDSTRWTGLLFGGQSVQLLGAEDSRFVSGASLQYAMPHPRVRFRNAPGELILEAYYHSSHSRGASQQPPNVSSSYGVLASARYSRPWGEGKQTFIEIGWGFQYANRRTVDLSGRLSSTPTFGAGCAFPWAGQEWVAVLRLTHVSNAGFEGNNQGQNQLLGMVGFRF